MYVVINELFVTPDNRKSFETNFTASMRATQPAVPGLQAARLLAPNEDDHGYLSMLEFTDEAAYSGYRGSRAFRDAHHWPEHAPINSNRLTTYQIHAEIPLST